MNLTLLALYLYLFELPYYYMNTDSRLSVFWIAIVLNAKSNRNEQVIQNASLWESKLLDILNYNTALESKPLNLSVTDNCSVVVDRLDFDSYNSYLKLFFYVWRNNVFQPSPVIVLELNRLPEDWLAVSLGMQVVERPKVYDTDAYEKVDDFIWVIGIVTSCFLGVLFICWLFIFIYAYFLQATAMVKWLPKPSTKDAKQSLYKQEKPQLVFPQKEFIEKVDSQIQTDISQSSEVITSEISSTQNQPPSGQSVVDAKLPGRLSPVSETNLEESLKEAAHDVSDSIVPLSATQNLSPSDQNVISNEKSHEDNKKKESKEESVVENEDDLLQENEANSSTQAFGSFENVTPLVMSIQPRPEAIQLANILNTQKIVSKS
uniref:Uncharacterized protein n=1 Tax=Trichobilharzia regenti TaxID=157069 RepID=A0AA85KFX4_TRIRE|nr:unnamed protein product [Trichobilharzia regenti]